MVILRLASRNKRQISSQWDWFSDPMPYIYLLYYIILYYIILYYGGPSRVFGITTDYMGWTARESKLGGGRVFPGVKAAGA